jgi:hypothetical protein
MALVLTIGLIAARLAPSRGVYTIAEVQVGLDLWLGAILLVRIPLVSQHRPTPQYQRKIREVLVELLCYLVGVTSR